MSGWTDSQRVSNVTFQNFRGRRTIPFAPCARCQFPELESPGLRLAQASGVTSVGEGTIIKDFEGRDGILEDLDGTVTGFPGIATIIWLISGSWTTNKRISWHSSRFKLPFSRCTSFQLQSHLATMKADLFRLLVNPCSQWCNDVDSDNLADGKALFPDPQAHLQNIDFSSAFCRGRNCQSAAISGATMPQSCGAARFSSVWKCCWW